MKQYKVMSFEPERNFWTTNNWDAKEDEHFTNILNEEARQGWSLHTFRPKRESIVMGFICVFEKNI